MERLKHCCHENSEKSEFHEKGNVQNCVNTDKSGKIKTVSYPFT